MKKMLLAILPLFSLLVQQSFAQVEDQPLPTSAIVRHYKLAVGLNATTVLIFPAPIKPAPGDSRVPIDRGSRGFSTQKQPGVENVLKLKAARKDFTPTNLHVFTADGKLFAFDISYLDSPAHTTYDLSNLPQEKGSTQEGQAPTIVLSSTPFNVAQMNAYITRAKTAKSFFSTASRHYQMKTKLSTIFRAGDLLFFGLTLSNHASLDYTIDFIKLYIQDKQKLKRSSEQQLEIIPVYKDTLTTIPGHSTQNYIVVIPKVTIPEHKEFILEVYEKNGGRQQSLRIKNKQLFRSRSF